MRIENTELILSMHYLNHSELLKKPNLTDTQKAKPIKETQTNS